VAHFSQIQDKNIWKGVLQHPEADVAGHRGGNDTPDAFCRLDVDAIRVIPDDYRDSACCGLSRNQPQERFFEIPRTKKGSSWIWLQAS
jgi:hypothetical protein